MNTTSIRLSYRPIRVGWCISEGSLDQFRKSIRLTSTLWGGRFNPIVVVAADSTRAQTLVQTFKVDVLYPLNDAPETAQFIQQNNQLRWPGFRNELFVEGGGGKLPFLLDVYHPVRKMADARHKPTLHGGNGESNLLTRLKVDNDLLRDALLATFGDYPDGDYCPIDYARFTEALLGTTYLEFLPDVEVSADFWQAMNPLRIGLNELLIYKEFGGWNTPGVFVGDPTAFSDLVTYWNLRAANIETFFYPESGDARLIPAIRSWINRLRMVLKGESELVKLPALWCTRELTWGAYQDIFEGENARHLISPEIWNGLNVKAPHVRFEEESALGTLDDSGSQISVSFPLSGRPFLRSAETSHQHAIVTARPLIDPKPTIGTFHLPYIPELNDFFRRAGGFIHSQVRVERTGIGIIVRLDDSDLQLHGVSPLQLLQQVFLLAGINSKQSSAGKVALRLIQHMGGLEDCRVFKIKGVRKLLDEFSLSKSFTHTQALARIGPDFEPYKTLFIGQRDYTHLRPQDVFLYLVRSKVFRPGLQLSCGSCGLDDWHSLNDLADQVACPYCGTEIDCGPQLQDGAWNYRVSGLFARSREHEGSIPVALALLQVSRCLDLRGMTWVTGTDLSWDDSGTRMDAESDFVVLVSDYTNKPQIILSECKTNMEINESQLERLAIVAARCSNTGLKTFVMFAKAGGPFSERELELIDSHQTIDLNFILLTPAELEPYKPYENFDRANIRSAVPHSLDEWAAYSRKLYLKTQSDEILKRHSSNLK